MVSSGQINLSWTSNDTVQNGFNLFRSTDGTNFTEIATTAASVTSYADMGLSASTTYYYKINAYDSVGASAYSNTASATTNAPGHLSRQLPSGQPGSALPDDASSVQSGRDLAEEVCRLFGQELVDRGRAVDDRPILVRLAIEDAERIAL